MPEVAHVEVSAPRLGSLAGPRAANVGFGPQVRGHDVAKATGLPRSEIYLAGCRASYVSRDHNRIPSNANIKATKVQRTVSGIGLGACVVQR